MLPLRGRCVLLGITAGIAAYKGAELARLLVKAGAEVQVVMTPAAAEFIGPLTLQAITAREVRLSLFDTAHEAAMGHIELARWADLILVAPATADAMAQLAAGSARDLLTTLCLASDAPVYLAPAMNQAMWRHPATRDNVTCLVERDVTLLGPAAGEQACGDIGPGRMLEPAQILEAVCGHFVNGSLRGRRVLLTAGPTHEALDPVRFIGNRSSGKMGFALAEALLAQGAEVTLVSGPVVLETPQGAERIDVVSAQQMYDATLARAAQTDIFIACAAVADYRPAEVAEEKIKKGAGDTLTLSLLRNPDILADVAALAEARPFCVGFAAETQNIEGYAEQKRKAKGLDMIAANQVGASLGFESDDNALLVLWEGGRETLERQSKTRLAARLVDLIVERFDAQTSTKDH